MESLKLAIEKIVRRVDLSAEESERAMGDILSGQATAAQIGAFLAGLRLKGEVSGEMLGCARAMRASATPVRPHRSDMVDTCGTGGDMAGTFNISTVAAFVVAGAGVPVAKHGNRSVSSRCGSADLLEALGVDLSLTPEMVATCIDEVGIGFLFAPRLHPAMAHAVGPRRELGFRTIFNILGPLTNPAAVEYQVMGVFDPELTEPLAAVLGELGVRRALVVHGHGGLDELSTTGPNRVSEMRDRQVTTFTVDALDLGLARADRDDLLGGDPAANAAIARRILAGEPGPKRDVVLLNAAAALYVAGAVRTLAAGVDLAERTLDEGRAAAVAEHLVTRSQSLAQAAA